MRYLLLLVATSCSWGLGESRGYNAKRTEVAMAEVATNAHALRPILERLEDMEIREEAVEVVRRIEYRAFDIAETSRTAQADHDHLPEEEIVLDSEEDQRQVNIYAGKADARETRRRKFREFIPNVFKFIVAAGAKVIPGPIRWLLLWGTVAIVFTGILSAILWIRGKFYKNASREYNDAIESLPPEQRAELGKTRPLMSKAHKILK